MTFCCYFCDILCAIYVTKKACHIFVCVTCDIIHLYQKTAHSQLESLFRLTQSSILFSVNNIAFQHIVHDKIMEDKAVTILLFCHPILDTFIMALLYPP